jgi:hypothetical protein
MLRAIFVLVFSVACAAFQPAPAHAQSRLPESFRAVCRQPSHGISCTCIWTSQGRSFFLGCGHGYSQPGETRKPIVLDVPSPSVGDPQRTGGIRLVALDVDLDLSLVEVLAGPMPYVAPVAPVDRQTRLALSCGYDNMRLPGDASPLWRYAHIVSQNREVTYTQERPWHGRSGGGLIDADTGELIGTCIGYETEFQRRGMYTNLRAIHAFLERFYQQSNSGNWRAPGGQAPRQRQIFQRPQQIFQPGPACPT